MLSAETSAEPEVHRGYMARSIHPIQFEGGNQQSVQEAAHTGGACLLKPGLI